MSREYVLQPFRAPVELQIDYAAELNEQQHAAVTAPPGPALVSELNCWAADRWTDTDHPHCDHVLSID